MTRGEFSRIAAVCACVVGAVPLAAVAAQEPPALAALLAGRSRVVAVRVYHLDERRRTYRRVSPTELSLAAGETVRDRGLAQSGIDALLRSRPLTSFEPGDVRWRVTYLDAAGRRMATATTDAFGEHGTVGEAGVAYETASLVAWLHAHFR